MDPFSLLNLCISLCGLWAKISINLCLPPCLIPLHLFPNCGFSSPTSPALYLVNITLCFAFRTQVNCTDMKIMKFNKGTLCKCSNGYTCAYIAEWAGCTHLPALWNVQECSEGATQTWYPSTSFLSFHFCWKCLKWWQSPLCLCMCNAPFHFSARSYIGEHRSLGSIYLS